MDEISIYEGVIIGAVGGAVAGLIIWIAELIRTQIIKKCEMIRVEKWLKKSGTDWRSTRAIASHNNLTEDRIRYLCSYSSKIILNTKDGNESVESWKYK